MSEAENKKPAVSKVAVMSFGLTILGLCVFFALLLLRESVYKELLVNVFAFMVGFLISTGLALGIISHWRIRKSPGHLRGKVLSTAGILLSIVAIFAILFLTPDPDRKTYYVLSCGSNLRGLGVAMLLYANDYNDQYPSLKEWCDLLKKQEDLNDKQFICKAAFNHDDKGPCHYAMNPNCEPNSPPETVLFFETKGGWNQYGGPELLTFDHHSGKCWVAFNDKHVELIKPEDVNKLKWKAEDDNK